MLVFDLPADHLSASAPAPLPPLFTDEEAAAAKLAFDAALKASSEVELRSTMVLLTARLVDAKSEATCDARVWSFDTCS